MSKRTFVMCLTVGFLAAPFLGGAALASEQSQSPEATYTKKMTRPADTIPSVSILPPEISKSLKIARIPTNRPIPLIVGTYWNCAVNAQDFEICRFKIVVCTDDQSLCTQVN